MTALEAVAALSLAGWAYLALAHGRFWLCGERLEGRDPAPARWPAVVAVVPARDEAYVLPRTLRSLLDCIEECEARGIRMYGGGQFELGPGRRQIQRLASVFYADAPNDVAPSEYNEGPARPGLLQSPLPPREGSGF